VALSDRHCRKKIPNNSVTLALARREAMQDTGSYDQPMTTTGKLPKHHSVFRFTEISVMVEMETSMTPSVKTKDDHGWLFFQLR